MVKEMYFRAKIFFLFFILLSILATGTTYAGLLVTDSAVPVETGHAEVELNGSYTHDSSEDSGVTTKTDSTDADITVTAGITKGLDIAVAVPYTFAGRAKIDNVETAKNEGLNDSTVALKYQFFEASGVKLAIKPGLILPTGETRDVRSDGKFGYTAALLATKKFNEGRFALHANAGYERHNYKDHALEAATRHDIFSVSIAGEAEIVEGLQLAADTGLATNADRTSDIPPAYALVGLKYELSELLEGYAGVKFSLTDTEADLTALLGAVLKF